MMRAFLTVLGLLQMATSAVAAQTRSPGAGPPETYDSAAIDSNGNLAIVKTNGQSITILKEGEQTAFSAPVVSSGRTAVGAQALFANCCTSYDIPLQLVVYSAGKAHRFQGVGLPIFQWGFANGGARVAYGQEPVHFGCATHYELRDIETERLIESVDVPQPCGQIPDPKPVKIPQWVEELTAKRQ
jgi:hypothetical protein